MQDVQEVSTWVVLGNGVDQANLFAIRIDTSNDKLFTYQVVSVSINLLYFIILNLFTYQVKSVPEKHSILGKYFLSSY